MAYHRGRELTFADSIVNGEDPFMLRRLRHNRFDPPSSQEVHANYLKELDSAIKSEPLNQENLK